MNASSDGVSGRRSFSSSVRSSEFSDLPQLNNSELSDSELSVAGHLRTPGVEPGGVPVGAGIMSGAVELLDGDGAHLGVEPVQVILVVVREVVAALPVSQNDAGHPGVGFERHLE